MREETGLEVLPLGILKVFERIIRDPQGAPEYHYVLIDYICRLTGGTPAPGDDVSALAWVARRALGNYRITEGTLPVIEMGFARRREYR